MATTYAGKAGRRIFDADSHVMETLEMLEPFADEPLRGLLKHWDANGGPNSAMAEAKIEFAQRQGSSDLAAQAEENLMESKLWRGMGAFDPTERTRALDLLGFDAQLVFGTLNLFLAQGEPKRIPADVLYSRSTTFNAAMAEFCRADKRLLGVANVPLVDPARSIAEAQSAVAAGCRAVMISTVPPLEGPTMTNLAYEPLWSFLAESETPCVLHVGLDLGPNGGFDFVPPAMRDNGQGHVDLAGAEGQRLDHLGYMTIGTGPSLCLGAMAIEGVFERHPNLRVACVEQGASWVPSWLHTMDAAMPIAKRVYPNGTKLTMKPSDYIRRQCKFTPFMGENVGWMIATAGADLFLFSSDYPHVEGTTDPIAVFEATMRDVSDAERDKFYCDNFLELFPSLA